MNIDEICCCSLEDFQHDLVKSLGKRIFVSRFLSLLLTREKQNKKKI